MALAFSGQRLLDGEVVYLTADDRWSEDLADAHIVEGKADGATLEARGAPLAKGQKIVNATLIDVAREGATIVGKSARELIRANGPTVRLDLGKQARAAGH